jgi:hypothetical protein
MFSERPLALSAFALSAIFNDFNTSDLQQFRVKMCASLVSRFGGRYITLSRLLLEHGNGEEKENNETKTGAPELAHAAAVKFAP